MRSTPTAATLEEQGDMLFRLLVESVEEYAIFLLDRQGIVRTWNAGAQRIKGYRASEIIGKHFSQFYPAGTPPQKLADELAQAEQHGQFQEEGWRVRKDGRRFWASVVITALRSPSGEPVGFAKVTRDLTQQQEHQEERAALIASEARARAEAAARDTFLSIAAHELKTPMTSARLAAQLVRRSFLDAPNIDPLQRRSIEVVDEQIHRLDRLVTRLLESVRIQSEQFSLVKESCDLAELVRRDLDQIRPTATNPLVATLPETLISEVDPLRMEQVVANLVGNAIKFSRGDQPVTVSLERRGTDIQLVVQDQGIGIPEGVRARIFERFFQAAPGGSGMGLGLFITKEIVEAHGGTIEVQCPPEGGTRFSVTLPA